MKDDRSNASVPFWKREFPDGEPEIPQPTGNEFRDRIVLGYRLVPLYVALLVLFQDTDVGQWFFRGTQVAFPPAVSVGVLVFAVLSVGLELLARRLDSHPGPAWVTSLTKTLRIAMLPLIAAEIIIFFLYAWS